MGAIPSGVPIGLRSNIQVEFGPNASGVTADNLLGYLSRDISIPTAAPLKYGDFVGKGRHTGRRESMLAFLAGCPYNPYSNHAPFRSSTGLIGGVPREERNWSDDRAPFIRAQVRTGDCGTYATLVNTAIISSFITGKPAIEQAGFCVENTLITVAGVEDGTIATTINNLGGSTSNLAPSSSTIRSTTGGSVRALRTSNTLRFKDMANISVTFGGGGCNGAGCCGWFLLPNKWEVTESLGYSSGSTINATFQPWEACLCCWATGTDNVGLDANQHKLAYGNGNVLGCVMGTNGQWHGAFAYTLFVNWTGSPQVFTVTNGPYHTLKTVHKIYFVGDQYTLDLN